MGIKTPPYGPVLGKTYSLFGKEQDTSHYFSLISSLTDDLVEEFGQDSLLAMVRRAGRENSLVRNLLGKRFGRALAGKLLEPYRKDLDEYLLDVRGHLRGVKLREGYKSVLWTTERQYLLYMFEIELSNRKNREAFNGRQRRFALLPHCLRDTWESCRAEYRDYDLVCRHCNADCYINHLSRILLEKHIEPYLWTTRNLKNLFREFAATGETFGVLGIACIPELVMGLRRSERYGIPAIGVPLNANNCIRWRGSYLPNSVDLEQLRNLVSSHQT